MGIDHFDVVIHLGAFTPVTKEDQNDLLNNTRTILNTQYLLNALPGKTGKFILISSCAVYGLYGQNSDVDIDEYTPVRPDTQYGFAKYSCELLVKDWALKNKVCYQIVRLSNVYGPGDNRVNSLIYTWICNALTGKNIKIYGNPNTLRNYLFIDELCNRLVDGLNSKIKNVTVNLVSNDISLEDIARAVVEASNNKVEIEFIRTSDMFSENTRYKTRYNFENKFYVGIREGILRTYNFMEECEKYGKTKK